MPVQFALQTLQKPVQLIYDISIFSNYALEKLFASGQINLTMRYHHEGNHTRFKDKSQVLQHTLLQIML